MLGITLHPRSFPEVVQFVTDTLRSKTHAQIVSLNPEILMAARSNTQFAEVIRNAQVHIVDGTGVVVAAKLLSETTASRVTGVYVLEHLFDHLPNVSAEGERVRVVFAGGKHGVAHIAADKFNTKYSQKGYRFSSVSDLDVNDPELVADVVKESPHILFVSLGSPKQELWIESNKSKLPCICMGVGGAFDFIALRVPRAPKLLQNSGLEWLYRLIVQPWRARRQLQLFHFAWAVFQEAVRKRLGR